jgi:hypothetical protein
MKTALTIVFTLLLHPVFGQTGNFQVLLDSAKTLFLSERGFDQEELDKFDYGQVASILEKVVEINPGNAEARYFLGYTYSRINSRDGRSMLNMKKELVVKASEQFEKVNKLSPKYNDEIIVLDPYSKLTAEWGALAISYLHGNQIDSAKWAFKQGEKRGGFSKFILSLNKSVLDACSPNSILISSGDNFTLPLRFLQTVEGYRKDVAVIDISLINTIWYPAYLSRNNIVKFDMSDKELETLDYTLWNDSTVTINSFSWTIKPSYYQQYLLRGDRVFLSLLKHNEFKREVYFTKGFNEASRLSLNDHVTALAVIDKLTIAQNPLMAHKDFMKSITNILKLSKVLNLNSPDEIKLYDTYRFALFFQVYEYLKSDDKQKASELMKLLDKYAHESKIPYDNPKAKEYAEYFRSQLY